MLAKLKSNWPVVTLLLISVILCVANYTPGTFLSGWDTLHPEFNFSFDFARTFFGVFRVEQGVGAVAAHSQMGDLPHVILLYILSFALPLNFLRYSYIFLNIIIGTLGMYYFLEKHFLKQKTASFLGALFYLLNIGTIQTFNVPFEMFTTLFMTLPFLFYFATGYITQKEGRRKNLLFFAFFSLLNSPSAYAATLWYMFFGVFFIYFLSLTLIEFKNDKSSIKHFLLIVTVFIFVNLFWILPNIYFVINHGTEVQNANINVLFSQEAFYKNKEFGNIKDLLLLKTFYFDWNIYTKNGNFGNLLQPYISNFNNLSVLSLAYLFGLSFIFGAAYSYKKLKARAIPMFLILLVSLLFLINDNFPFSPVFNFFQNHIPLFTEAFRFPDDKILNIYSFLVSIFFGFSILFIIERIKKIHLRAELILGIIASMLIVYYSFPSFTGNFINYYMRVEIPKQYFNLFGYLNTQPQNARVADLPIESPYGWVYYNWYNDNKPSYQGAGFIWFGIKQPVLDMNFDRWSPYNESYYREMSYAIYSQNINLLTNVLNKYRIGFVLIDKSVISPGNPPGSLYFSQSKNMLKQTGLVQQELDFGNLELFKINAARNIVTSANTNLNVTPKTTTTYEDFAYHNSDYITESPDPDFTNIVMPFRDLIDNQSRLHQNIVNIQSDRITLNPSQTISNLNISSIIKNFNIIPSDLVAEQNGTSLNLSLYPNTPVLDNTQIASPIKIIAQTNGQKNLKLSFNNNESFNLNFLPPNTPLVLGRVLLLNGVNEISLFNTSNVQTVANVSNIINPLFSSCVSGETPPSVGISPNRIDIASSNDTCIVIPYSYLTSFLKSRNANISVSFGFNLNGNAKINSCLYNTQTASCINPTNLIKNGNSFQINNNISSDNINSLAIRISIQNPNPGKNMYSLSNLSSNYSASVSDITLPQSVIAGIFTNQNNLSFSKIYLSRNTSYNLDLEGPDALNLKNICPSKNTNAQKNLLNENNVKAIQYTSYTGSFCDEFSFQSIPHNQGYLVAVGSKNVAGLPLNLCISDQTSEKCDIYTKLSQFKNFNTDVFLLPPMDTKGLGYAVNLENPGVIGTPAINYISSVQFIPIPYQFLTSIESKGQNINNNLSGTVENVTEYNPLFYLVKTNGQPIILNLNLSFENGFKAYDISCSNYLSCFIQGFFSPLIGKEEKNHVPVDNWANGWILNGSASQVAIIFLPQYLEYAGFLILIILFIILSIPLFKKIKRNR